SAARRCHERATARPQCGRRRLQRCPPLTRNNIAVSRCCKFASAVPTNPPAKAHGVAPAFAATLRRPGGGSCPPAVLDHPRALAQYDGDVRPAFAGGAVVLACVSFLRFCPSISWRSGRMPQSTCSRKTLSNCSGGIEERPSPA